MWPAVPGPVFTPLEQAVLLAYYGDFARLPRPATLEPASHRQAARRLGRTTDSARKAIERINDKIARAQDPPPAATGRHLSAEIGRWLARAGALDAIEALVDIPAAASILAPVEAGDRRLRET